MHTVTTRQGKTINVISQYELRSPLQSGNYVRAYCHIHGSDHQRSLSINRSTGWGRCFNAACMGVVLVEEWSTPVQQVSPARTSLAPSRSASTSSKRSRTSRQSESVYQPLLLYPSREVPRWQEDELSALSTLAHPMQRQLLQSARARSYLVQRRIPLDIALMAGLGYLPPHALTKLPRTTKQHVHRWTERIAFPLTSPYGRGYIGRTLRGWQPGMNEREHKTLLDSNNTLRRWIKTNPAGWFCSNLDQLARCIILVEGGFDRLTLLAAGFAANEVVALAGTAAHIEWLPPQVKAVVLALDGDEGGRAATEKLAEECTHAGLHVSVCSPGNESSGKDWNERWRLSGVAGLQPLYNTLAELSSELLTA